MIRRYGMAPPMPWLMYENACQTRAIATTMNTRLRARLCGRRALHGRSTSRSISSSTRGVSHPVTAVASNPLMMSHQKREATSDPHSSTALSYSVRRDSRSALVTAPSTWARHQASSNRPRFITSNCSMRTGLWSTPGQPLTRYRGVLEERIQKGRWSR